MTKVILISFFVIFYSNNLISQTVDTLRFKSIGNLADTMYYTKEKLAPNSFKVTRYYGLSDNSNLTTSVDTLLVGKNKWRRYYKNRIVPFLSVKDFNAGTTINEFLNKDNSDFYYNKYIPVKMFRIDRQNFYLYRVVPMYGKGPDNSLGDGPYHIVFNFDYGEVYRSTFHITKVLEGFEDYVKDFKW